MLPFILAAIGGALIGSGLKKKEEQKFADGGEVGDKFYDIMHNVGKSKYVVNYHNGVKKHGDGSAFSDIAIFKSKKELDKFEKSLLKDGYKYKYADGGYISNQYIGKTPEKVWEEWTVQQRGHFFKDHYEEFQSADWKHDGDEPLSYEKVAKTYTYEELPHIVQTVLGEHIQEGAYKRGGETKKSEKISKEEFVAKSIVYDNGGKTFDRYTVFTPDGSVYGMSETASGFNQYCGDNTEIEKGSHLGKRLKSVPKEIEWAVIGRMEEEFADGGSIEIEGNDLLKDFVVNTNDYARENHAPTLSKGDLMKMAYGEHYSNVDSALPMGMLEELGINNNERWHYVMDFNNKGAFGNLTDLFNVLAKKNPVIEVWDEDDVTDILPILEAAEKYKDKDVYWQLKRYAKGGSVDPDRVRAVEWVKSKDKEYLEELKQSRKKIADTYPEDFVEDVHGRTKKIILSDFDEKIKEYENKKYRYAKGGEVEAGNEIILTTSKFGKEYEGMRGVVNDRKLINDMYSIKLENGLDLALSKDEFRHNSINPRYAKGGSIDSEVAQLWNGYAEAVLFTSTDSDTEEPLDSAGYSIHDFDEQTVKSSKKMLADYYKNNKEAIEESGIDLDTVGNDIWYTRSGQGVGFFDHSLDKELEDKLTNGAKALGEYPTVETYDGKVSVRGGRVFKKGGITRDWENIKVGDIVTYKKGEYKAEVMSIDNKFKDMPSAIIKWQDNGKEEGAWLDALVLAKDTKMAEGGGIAKKKSLMSMANLVVKDWLAEKIKDWYTKTYPTDDLGEELNDDVSFTDLWNGIHKKEDVYEIMGVGDSLIRERLFGHLSEIEGVDYDYIYNKWLDSDYADGGTMANGGKIKSKSYYISAYNDLVDKAIERAKEQGDYNEEKFNPYEWIIKYWGLNNDELVGYYLVDNDGNTDLSYINFIQVETNYNGSAIVSESNRSILYTLGKLSGNEDFSDEKEITWNEVSKKNLEQIKLSYAKFWNDLSHEERKSWLLKRKDIPADYKSSLVRDNFEKLPNWIQEKVKIAYLENKIYKHADGGKMAKGGEVDEESHYFKNIVKRHLLELKEDIKNSKNTRESDFYKNRFDVQLRDYANRLGITETELKNKLSNTMARGGFCSKGEMVWGKITDSKKADFLYKNFTPQITPRSQETLVGKTWNFLPKNVKIKFESEYANLEDYANGGVTEDAFVVVSEKVYPNGSAYWTVMSKPVTSKEEAEILKDSTTPVRNETLKVVTLQDAREHKHIVGEEYLKEFAKGGAMDKGGISNRIKYPKITVYDLVPNTILRSDDKRCKELKFVGYIDYPYLLNSEFEEKNGQTFTTAYDDMIKSLNREKYYVVNPEINTVDKDLFKSTIKEVLNKIKYNTERIETPKDYKPLLLKIGFDTRSIYLYKNQNKLSHGGTIDTDTPIVPEIVADDVSLDEYAKKYGIPKTKEEVAKANKTIPELTAYLVERANRHYKDNESFAKQIKAKGTKGLNSLKTFMEHWSKAYLDGLKHADGGTMDSGGKVNEKVRLGVKKEDIVISGVPRSWITEREWESILEMAKYIDCGTFILKDENNLEVVPYTEYDWSIKKNVTKKTTKRKLAEGRVVYPVFDERKPKIESGFIVNTKETEEQAKDFIKDKPDLFYEKSGNEYVIKKMAKGGETSRKGNYTGRVISNEGKDVYVGNISGWNGNGTPVYDIHECVGFGKRQGEKTGELQSTFIKKALSKK